MYKVWFPAPILRVTTGVARFAHQGVGYSPPRATSVCRYLVEGEYILGGGKIGAGYSYL